MSETLQVIRERRSCKSYKPDMIPEEVIQTIAEAGTWAPSGMGRQSAIIVAITNKELRDRLSRMNAQIMGADMDMLHAYLHQKSKRKTRHASCALVKRK